MCLQIVRSWQPIVIVLLTIISNLAIFDNLGELDKETIERQTGLNFQPGLCQLISKKD